MELILLERIEKLGNMGDVVKVKPGFARNFLLPQEKALRATKANLARFEAEREFLEQRNAENRDKAVANGQAVDGSDSPSDSGAKNSSGASPSNISTAFSDRSSLACLISACSSASCVAMTSSPLAWRSASSVVRATLTEISTDTSGCRRTLTV